MDESLLEIFAKEIGGIFREHHLTRTSGTDIHALSIAEAYAVQERFVADRIGHGERVVGYKVGCTSPAIRVQLGLSQPICGRLMSGHVYRDGATLGVNGCVDCGLEAELVLRIGRDLDGSNLETGYLRGAIATVSPGIEVHNYRFWYGPPSSQELIASNGIHAAIIIGVPQELPTDLDLGQERTTLVVNGAEVSFGFAAELMDGGGPIESLRWLINHLKGRNHVLRAGDIVIPGAATQLIPVKAGDVAEARFTRFGSCRASFSDQSHQKSRLTNGKNQLY